MTGVRSGRSSWQREAASDAAEYSAGSACAEDGRMQTEETRQKARELKRQGEDAAERSDATAWHECAKCGGGWSGMVGADVARGAIVDVRREGGRGDGDSGSERGGSEDRRSSGSATASAKLAGSARCSGARARGGLRGAGPKRRAGEGKGKAMAGGRRGVRRG